MKRKGFTLIELLIVVAIIGALAAILLPAITMAWREVHKAGCSSNLKNIFTAMKIYAGSNNRNLPSVYGGTRNGTETWREDWEEGDGEALIKDHGTKEELELKDHDAFTCNTSALWLLVRDGSVDAKNLICPASDQETYVPEGELDDWWSFKQLKNCSYSYQNTLGKPLRDGVTRANLIILADVNPLRPDVRVQTREEKRADGVEDFQLNSPNHKFAGQNVVDMAGSVRWIDSPKGNRGNNIWVLSTWKDGDLETEDETCYDDNTAKIISNHDEWLVP